MEILVTGGNGYVGHQLVSALVDRGDHVRVLALPGEDASWLEAHGVEVHRGNICSPETLVAPMRDADAVLHLAAMMHVWRPLEDYNAVNVTGTENVCRAALAGGVSRFVHMSSSSVYGMASGALIDESFPLAPFPDPYPVSKAGADRLVQRLVREEGLPAAIVRPDQIFGPGDRLHFGAIVDRLRAGRGVVVGRGDNAIPLVYVSDAVQGLLLALDHEDAVGEVFNITNDEPLTQLEFLEAIAAEVGAARPRLRVPYSALYAAANAAERMPSGKHGEHRPPITRLGVAFLGSDVRCSIEKARTRLGFAPQVSLREGVRRAAANEVVTPASVRGRGGDGARSLAGQVAIVTGASSGIGAATARELATRGAHVVLAARRAHELRAIEREITAAGGSAVSIPTDLADREQVARLAKETDAVFGRVDVLVNNAGIHWVRSLVDTAPDAMAELLEVNLLSAMLLTRAVLPGMLERDRGAIIFVGSLSGRVAMEPLYSASKYGLRGYSLALRRQLADSGVSVSLVSPGNIRTEMTRHVTGRLPEPDVVAEAICDLVLRPRRELVIPRKHYAIAWLEQTAPTMADFVYRSRHWSPIQ